MAVAFATGFEVRQDVTDFDNSLNGTAAYSTAQARTGAASIRCNPASGASGYLGAPSGLVAPYVHFALYVATKPSLDRRILNNVDIGKINVRLTSTGALAVYLNTTLIGTSSTAFASPGWHWVGVRQVTGTSVVFLQIDEVDEVTGTATVTSTAPILGFHGTEASAVDAYFDDYIVDDAGFLSPSKVDIALPISDNTRTGVTGGAGGTIYLYEAVNNTPPAGLASASETDFSNIEYPASTTCDYIADLESYSTLGILTGDTILAVQALVRHGEDLSTGTKTAQNCGALTNPTVAGSNITFGSDGGAHGAETGVWVTQRGTVTTSPSVTLGTSPTIRTSRVSQARVGCIDFMGMVVAWTPVASEAIRAGLLQPESLDLQIAE